MNIFRSAAEEKYVELRRMLVQTDLIPAFNIQQDDLIQAARSLTAHRREHNMNIQNNIPTGTPIAANALQMSNFQDPLSLLISPHRHSVLVAQISRKQTCIDCFMKFHEIRCRQNLLKRDTMYDPLSPN